MSGTTRRRTRPRQPGRDEAPMRAAMTDAPITFNVAGLLADGVGTVRTLDVENARVELPDELVLAEPISGHVRLACTNRGILAEARLKTALAGECARCLRPLT